MLRLLAIPLLVVVLSGLSAFDARAEPPSSKTIRHWTATCDNLRACSAYGFAVALDETMIGAWLRLDRSGEAEAEPTLKVGFSFADSGSAAPKSLTLSDDGEQTFGPFPVEEGDDFYTATIPPADVALLLATFRGSDHLIATIDDAKSGPIAATLSLDGASAAMLWLDDEQQRVGTKTALVKPGPKPASAVPPVPNLPLIEAAAPTAAVPQTLPSSILDLAKNGDCMDAVDQIEPIVADLGRGRTLYGALCGSGAYNFSAQFWIAGEDGAPEPVRFELPPTIGSPDDPEGGLEGQGILINPSFDETTMTLAAFAKGRGIADCGAAETWVWDGEAFRLSFYSLMSDCEGVPSGDWPVMYRAEVR